MVEVTASGAAETGAAPEAGLGPAPAAVFDDFLPPERAAAMRAAIDAHFAKPYAHRPDSHQVWNYWFVPDTYTYLRTEPEKVFGGTHLQDFLATLQIWSLETLGLGTVTRPFLSLYVPGCRQGWHNDSGNGRFAFVYSLTRDDRRTIGGDTLVMREGDGLRRNLTRPAAGSGLYESIAPKFNRLVVFDDRIPHAVEVVQGAMDPVEGRFVLHGHIWESGTAVRGALPLDVVDPVLTDAVERFAADAGARVASLHGPLTLRLNVDPAGTVADCDVLIDRVVQPGADEADWDTLREDLLDRLEGLRFPPAGGTTGIVLPVLFGRRTWK